MFSSWIRLFAYYGRPPGRPPARPGRPGPRPLAKSGPDSKSLRTHPAAGNTSSSRLTGAPQCRLVTRARAVRSVQVPGPQVTARLAPWHPGPTGTPSAALRFDDLRAWPDIAVLCRSGGRRPHGVDHGCIVGLTQPAGGCPGPVTNYNCTALQHSQSSMHPLVTALRP
jgi:hypothetical protein